MLCGLGFDVIGVDMSEQGIAIAQKAYPRIHAQVGNVYDDLKAQYGTFPLVVSLEVIEHCMYPRLLVKTFLSLIAPGGVGILSTPYHGYWKNLALAVSGRMDQHFLPLWDGGHIKFFSIATLRELLAEQGAQDVKFLRVGRIPALAKSMIAIVHSAANSGGN
jgi:2-polyprenyl-3-methyl-5-hydroxy-6-metoxy-1,4-benzoquinol methylase